MGQKKNHIKNSRVKYIKGDTSQINKILLFNKKKFIHFFILENFLEYFKVLRILMNVLNQIL